MKFFLLFVVFSIGCTAFQKKCRVICPPPGECKTVCRDDWGDE